MKTAVIGLGKLGLPLAAVLASKGHEVVAVDRSKSHIDKLRQGHCPIMEPGLRDLLRAHNKDMRFDNDFIIDSLLTCKLFNIIVPTPSTDDGTFSNAFILEALRQISPVITRSKERPVVNIVSTVMPGSCETKFKPLLEHLTRQKCGVEFGLCYNPEFIAIGNVIRGLLEPDAVLIGESDTQSGMFLQVFYNTVLNNQPPIHHMTWWNAELSKLLLNCFVTMKISFANLVAELCQFIPMGNVDTIVGFLGDDSRVGNKYLQSGLGFGGTCFPRDNQALSALMKNITDKVVEDGIPAVDIPKVIYAFNKEHLGFVVRDITNLASAINASVVTILGVTYKPDTPVVEQSRALELAKQLAEQFTVKIYDPQGMINAKKELNAIYCDKVSEALQESDLCVIGTPWREFRNIQPELFVKCMKQPVVYDCWRHFNQETMEIADIEYYALGVAED